METPFSPELRKVPHKCRKFKVTLSDFFSNKGNVLNEYAPQSHANNSYSKVLRHLCDANFVNGHNSMNPATGIITTFKTNRVLRNTIPGFFLIFFYLQAVQIHSSNGVNLQEA
jgi:hypothetical protein